MDGHPEIVVQNAPGYQELLDRLERAETVAAVRRGMRDADEGRMIPLGAAVARLGAKHGF